MKNKNQPPGAPDDGCLSSEARIYHSLLDVHRPTASDTGLKQGNMANAVSGQRMQRYSINRQSTVVEALVNKNLLAGFMGKSRKPCSPHYQTE